MLLNGKIGEAGQMLFDNNPLSLVCCHVCPQENQCEGHCVLGKKGNPVQFSEIEQYISDYYLNIFNPEPSKKTKGKIAVIGSGPAGITISFILAKRDYDVTIFEGNDRIGGVLRYGIPEFRLPKDILNRLKAALLKMGVKVRPNTAIGSNLTVDDLQRDGYQAIFMGTGVWRPNKMNIKGESLGHVCYAIEYLRNPDVYTLGNRVAIIGAGNVAMDVARTAIRHGSTDVNIIYNKGEEDITARKVEAEYAKIDGTNFIFNKIALEIVDGGAILADTLITLNEDGSKNVVPLHETAEFVPFDTVVLAIGQGPRAVIVSSTTGINVNAKGLVSVDDVGNTSRDGVFASGDVVTGAKTVVEAVNVSRKVADAMDSYVQAKLRGEIK